jgi:formylglycine-generating enzyme required for sulfatase activity
MWDTVYQWAITNGYTDLSPGQKGYQGDATHPVTNVSWWDVVKWCNARSQNEGLTPLYYTMFSFTDTTLYKTGEKDLLITMVNWSANGYCLPTPRMRYNSAANGVLSLKTVSVHDAGNYDVTIKNRSGRVISQKVTLTVI